MSARVTQRLLPVVGGLAMAVALAEVASDRGLLAVLVVLGTAVLVAAVAAVRRLGEVVALLGEVVEAARLAGLVDEVRDDVDGGEPR